ncbi:MAG: hypothetical protein WC865_00270 [Bacteroidales bacterium]
MKVKLLTVYLQDEDNQNASRILPLVYYKLSKILTPNPFIAKIRGIASRNPVTGGLKRIYPFLM